MQAVLFRLSSVLRVWSIVGARRAARLWLTVAWAAIFLGHAHVAEAAAQDNHGSLAIDRNQGSRYGWAVDYADQGAADRRALSECQKLGGRCSVVMRFRNACAAYAADQATSSTAYGWGWSERDRATAERIARRECVKRGGVRSQCAIRVWGCITRGAQVEGARQASERRAPVSFGVGQRFRDCPECPEMVVVPRGSFRMGAPPEYLAQNPYTPWNDHEGPVHEVTFATPFALGVYEVTFAEWDACVAAEGCDDEDGGWNERGHARPRHPVVNVYWEGAQHFVQWLSRRTGQAYRLPTESEWEYAARAGTATAYSWGDDIGLNRAHCRACGGQGDPHWSVPVGSFPANAWGLHDMHGNVREWTQDCWNESYQGAPSDGTAWESGVCHWHVYRGGGFLSAGRLGRLELRAAYRHAGGASARDHGFRVARTLTP